MRIEKQHSSRSIFFFIQKTVITVIPSHQSLVVPCRNRQGVRPMAQREFPIADQHAK
jgi:hypothetical protein